MPEMAIQTQKLTRKFGNLTAVDAVEKGSLDRSFVPVIPSVPFAALPVRAS
jgi:hypothetical protein